MRRPALPRITKAAGASRGVGARLTMTSVAAPCLAWTGMEAAGYTTGLLALWNNSARRVASPITCVLRTVDAHQAYHVRQRRSQTTEPTKTHPLVTSSAAFGPAPPTVPTSAASMVKRARSEEHTSELQSQSNLVCRLLLEKKKDTSTRARPNT